MSDSAPTRQGDHRRRWSLTLPPKRSKKIQAWRYGNLSLRNWKLPLSTIPQICHFGMFFHEFYPFAKSLAESMLSTRSLQAFCSPIFLAQAAPSTLLGWQQPMFCQPVVPFLKRKWLYHTNRVRYCGLSRASLKSHTVMTPNAST